MENGIFRKMGAVVLAGGALFVGANASAQGDEYVISYKYDELASVQGVEDVHARIVKAAKEYCPTYQEAGSLYEVKVCVEGVVEDLVSKVNHPQLTSLHEDGSVMSVVADNSRRANR